MLTESLNYQDMKDQLIPLLGIDEFESRIGEDYDIITLNFMVKSKEVGEDLVIWLERGYDFVIDAETSPGEIENDKYYVFVEINRRKSSAKRIIELLKDLETLTDLKINQWSLKINGKLHKASTEIIEHELILSPSEYKNNKEVELNEWRNIANLNHVSFYDNDDQDLKAIQRQAGIYKKK